LVGELVFYWVVMKAGDLAILWAGSWVVEKDVKKGDDAAAWKAAKWVEKMGAL